MQRSRRQLAQHIGAYALVLSGGAALSACGFEMRRSTALPFQRLYTTFAASSEIGAEFRRLIRANGDTELVTKPEDAEVILDVVSELREKEIVTFSSTGRPREYQLRQRLAFQLLDAKRNQIAPVVELIQRRDITTSDTQLAAKQQEEVLLYREMQSELLQQLLRRLAAVKRRG